MNDSSTIASPFQESCDRVFNEPPRRQGRRGKRIEKVRSPHHFKKKAIAEPFQQQERSTICFTKARSHAA